MQTLVAISALLQRERTALKLLLQLLVNQRNTLQLGDIVPVGDLFDVIVAGDEPFTQAMRLNFDHAKKLYRQKLLSMLEQEHGVAVQDVLQGAVDPTVAQRFRTDDRLLKTLILSALAPPAAPPRPAIEPTPNRRRSIGGREALALLDRIKHHLAAQPDLVLDLDWRLYRRDEAVS